MAGFTPGQRWVSDSESELGLGTVLSQDARLVVMLFPASGETRHYALRNAPLTRVRFSPGDSITHHEGWSMIVSDVVEEDGLLAYAGLRDDGTPAAFAETMLDNFFNSGWPAIVCSPARSTPCPGSACALKACAISAASSARRCLAWPEYAPNRSAISCISPATLPTAWRHACCWLTKWVWAKPSKPAWSCIASCRPAASVAC